MNSLNKIAQHFFTNIEVCDNTIFKWSNSLDVPGSSTDHSFSFRSNCKRTTVAHIYCNNTWLVQNNTATANITIGQTPTPTPTAVTTTPTPQNT